MQYVSGVPKKSLRVKFQVGCIGNKFLMKRYDFSATRWLLVPWITHCSKMRHYGLIHILVKLLHINGTNKFAVPLATPSFGTFNLLKYLLILAKN